MNVFKESASKDALQPMSTTQRELVKMMERGVVNDPILKELGMDLSGNAFKIYTTVAMFLRAATIYLDTSDELDLGGMMLLERDYREHESAEKTGNLVAKIKIGEILKAISQKQNMELGILEVTTTSGAVISIPVKRDFTEKDRLVLNRIQTQAAKLLTGYKYGLNPDDWIIYLISMLAMKHALIVCMSQSRSNEEHRSMFNFADIIEMTVTYSTSKDEFKVKCQPGKEAKLNVKSDNTTER